MKWAAASLAIALAGCTDDPSLPELARSSLSRLDGEIRLDGLQEDVEVVRDRYGIPHIYAKNLEDLFFAQGFVVAQDRLWQMEVWRRHVDDLLSLRNRAGGRMLLGGP